MSRLAGLQRNCAFPW